MCLTRTQLATGLMYRPGITNDESMLFVFPQPQQVAFYMKNVGFDIDTAYIDSSGVIQQIVRLRKMDGDAGSFGIERHPVCSGDRSGWFERNGIGAGALIKTPRRSLRENLDFSEGRMRLALAQINHRRGHRRK